MMGSLHENSESFKNDGQVKNNSKSERELIETTSFTRSFRSGSN